MLNEHDIEDMCNLYELRNGDKFKVAPEDVAGEPVKVPVGREEPNLELEYLFDHIDGMYSYCTNSAGQVVHFAAWTRVKKV